MLFNRNTTPPPVRKCPQHVSSSHGRVADVSEVDYLTRLLLLNESTGMPREAKQAALADILGHHQWRHDTTNYSELNVIYQLPLDMADSALAIADKKESQKRLARYHEFVRALQATLLHPKVSSVHLLTENPMQQVKAHQVLTQILMGEVDDDRKEDREDGEKKKKNPLPPHQRQELLRKFRTYNIASRMTFAQAVLYANRFFPANSMAMISTADCAVHGPEWNRLSAKKLAGKLLGLTRHEQQGCARTCDCMTQFDGCHDTFVFVTPLSGGDALLEQVSFRVGGLWGSENRFLWEAQRADMTLRVVNPCRTLRMMHYHCQDGGEYRPSQDQRRVNVDGKSLAPEPDIWKE